MGTVAKIVAASMGVEVVFDASADTASTDGTRIIIPTSLIGNGDAHAAILMRGFIAHEGVGHIRHTDMAAWRAFAQDASPLGKSILNIIEDIRIERLACKVYPGIKRILNETVEALKPEGFFDLPTKPHPAGVITGLLLNCLRAEELGQALDPIPARAMAFKMFGLSLRDDILNIASNGSRGCSTAEAVDATKTILKLLGEVANSVANSVANPLAKPVANPDPIPEHFPETMDDQAGEDASGSETGSEAGSVSKQAPSPSQQRSLKQSKSAAKTLTATADDCGPSGLEEITQKAMELSVGASQGLDEMPRSIVASPLQNWRPSVRSAGISRTLSRKLEDMLQSRVDEEDFSVRGGGRLDAKRVSRTRVLDLEVFEREGKEAPGLNTALFVLVDKSGSMSSPIGTSSDTTEAVALDAVSALGDALARFDGRGVSFSVEGFSQTMTSYKSFSASWRGTRACLGRYHASGGTDFTSACFTAIGEIAKRPEKRKVILALTDGDVGELPLLASMQRTANKHGIETRVVFLGIEPNAARFMATHGGFARYGVANQAGEVAKAVFAALEDTF
jgi:uncharacterized protein YjhX (UPF0386 family)